MINSSYLIDYSDWFDEGGYCQVYPIKDKKKLIFKEFRNKKKAQESYSYQKKLAKFDLSPQIYSRVCKLNFAEDGDIHFHQSSDWGYVIEMAKTHKANTKITMADIQSLVDEIYSKTGLKFWDSHWYNVGVIKRGQKKKVVCIDTGKESFSGYCNAWGFAEPGPQCCYCNKYQCNCTSN